MARRILLVALLASLASCAKSTPSAPAATHAEPAQSSTSTDALLAPPAHNYVYEKDGVYGYEGQLSEDQRNAGEATAPLFMVRYGGEHHGVYRAQSVKGGYTTDFSCSTPCRYITIKIYYYKPIYSATQFGVFQEHENELVDKEVIPARHTVAAAIMQDAMNGQLIPYDQTPAVKAAAAKRAAYEQKQKQQELRQQQQFAAQRKATLAREAAEQVAQEKQMATLQAQEKQSRQLEQLNALDQGIPEWASFIQSEKRRYRAYVTNDTGGVLANYYRSRISEIKGDIAKSEAKSASAKRALYSGAQAFLNEWCQTGSVDPTSKDNCNTVQGYLVDSRQR